MKVRELIQELEYFDGDTEFMAVQQPNYPLTADLNRVEELNGTVYIHLYDADGYYSEEEE